MKNKIIVYLYNTEVDYNIYEVLYKYCKDNNIWLLEQKINGSISNNMDNLVKGLDKLDVIVVDFKGSMNITFNQTCESCMGKFIMNNPDKHFIMMHNEYLQRNYPVIARNYTNEQYAYYTKKLLPILDGYKL